MPEGNVANLTAEELLERIARTRNSWGEFGFWADGEYGRGGGDWVTVADILDDLLKPQWDVPHG
jgi:hypothetical protein